MVDNSIRPVGKAVLDDCTVAKEMYWLSPFVVVVEVGKTAEEASKIHLESIVILVVFVTLAAMVNCRTVEDGHI